MRIAIILRLILQISKVAFNIHAIAIANINVNAILHVNAIADARFNTDINGKVADLHACHACVICKHDMQRCAKHETSAVHSGAFREGSL